MARFERRALRCSLVEPDSTASNHHAQSRFFDSISSIEYFLSTRLSPNPEDLATTHFDGIEANRRIDKKKLSSQT